MSLEPPTSSGCPFAQPEECMNVLVTLPCTKKNWTKVHKWWTYCNWLHLQSILRYKSSWSYHQYLCNLHSYHSCGFQGHTHWYLLKKMKEKTKINKTYKLFIKVAMNYLSHTCTVHKAIPWVTWVTGAVIASRDVRTIGKQVAHIDILHTFINIC